MAGRHGVLVTVAAGLLALIFGLAACQPGAGGQAGKKLPPVGEALMDEYHKSCLKSGGAYVRHEDAKSFVCEGVPSDAGKYCTRSSDCESACLARSHSCAPVKPLFGCNEVLDAGGLAVTECID